MRGNGRVFLRGRYWWIASQSGAGIPGVQSVRQKSGGPALLRTRLSALERDCPLMGRRGGIPWAPCWIASRPSICDGGAGGHAVCLAPEAAPAPLWCRPHRGSHRERYRAVCDEELRRKKANATINKQLGILGRALRLAQREGIIVRLPHLARLPGRTGPRGLLGAPGAGQDARCPARVAQRRGPVWVPDRLAARRGVGAPVAIRRPGGPDAHAATGADENRPGAAAGR